MSVPCRIFVYTPNEDQRMNQYLVAEAVDIAQLELHDIGEAVLNDVPVKLFYGTARTNKG